MYLRLTKYKMAFTLLEMLVSVSIFSVIMLCIYQALYSGDRSSRLGAGIVSLQENTRNMVYYLTRDIRESKGTLSTTTLTSVGDNLSLSIPDNSTVITVTYQIALSSQNVRQLQRNGMSVGNYVNTVGLTVTGSTANITVDTEKQIGPQETETFTLTGKVKRRNN